MNTRKFSKRQEKAVAKAWGGKVQANSGATAFRKGDVLTDKFLIECKTSATPKKSFTIQKEVLEKAEEERFAMGKEHFAVAIDFGCPDQMYYILTDKTLKILVKDSVKLEGEHNEHN